MFNYKLKPNSMSVVQYEKELELFNNDEYERHADKLQSFKIQFLTGSVTPNV